MRILVVEDELEVARFIERGLKEERFAVNVASDGEEGLYLARSNLYDLIVVDVNLPKRDGFEVLHGLRSGGNTARVLMLTARDGVEDQVRGLDGGADLTNAARQRTALSVTPHHRRCFRRSTFALCAPGTAPPGNATNAAPTPTHRTSAAPAVHTATRNPNRVPRLKAKSPPCKPPAKETAAP